jgi:membrane fusion protein, multidrug efflux system
MSVVAQGGEVAAAREREGAPAAVAAPARPRNKRRIALVAAVGVSVLAGTWWATQRGLESTDDAQVDADVVAPASRASGVVIKVTFEDNQVVKAGQVLAELDPEPARARLAQAEASLEAARANALAAEAEANLVATSAQTGHRVASASLSAASAGAVSSRDQITEARARVTAAESGASQAKLELERTARLVQGGALGQAALDQARTAHDTAAAALAQARAHLSVLQSGAAQAASHVQEASARAEQASKVDLVIAQAEARSRASKAKVAELEAARDLARIDLSYATIRAPEDGIVSKKGVAVGQTISAGAPIVQLVPERAVWVTANFKETQVGSMREGQPVAIEVDAFPGVKMHGVVQSFSAATGARFALLPPDNATGNYTKVVQRIPLRVRLEDGPARALALRPGMSASVTVDTRK